MLLKFVRGPDIEASSHTIRLGSDWIQPRQEPGLLEAKDNLNGSLPASRHADIREPAKFLMSLTRPRGPPAMAPAQMPFPIQVGSHNILAWILTRGRGITSPTLNVSWIF